MDRSKLFILLTLIALTALLALLTPGVRAWQVTISDCQGCGSRADAVVVDAAGDVIATGGFFYGSDVVKLSGSTGQLIWRSEVMGHESRNYAQDIAIDSHGDVIVVFAWTRIVVKVSGADGTEIWRKPIGGTINALLPIISAVAVDREDNVITGGTMGGYFNVCKLDGHNGDEKWHYDARGGDAKGVAVDRNGDVAAAGIMSNNFATVKLSGVDGRELWHHEINGPGNFTNDFEEARAVAVGADGSVVAAGVTVDVTGDFNDCTNEFTVVKYDASGERKWVQIINGRLLGYDDHNNLHNGATDEANAVTIDGDGDVIAAGSFQVSHEIDVMAPEHFQVFKFSGDDGTILWGNAATDALSDEIPTFGRAFALSTDTQNNVVAAGTHNFRFTGVKFSANTGEQLWLQQPFSGDDRNQTNARDVVMDADDNVVIAGESLAPDQFSRFTVTKLRGTDGTDYFTTPPVPEVVVKYAPLVYLHQDDKYRPGNPLTFINNSSLNWFHEGGCEFHVTSARGTVQASRLGAESSTPYIHNPIINGASCEHRPEIEFKAHDYTRPWDGSERCIIENNCFWNDSFYEKEGFYLDQDDRDEIRQGIKSIPGNPIYPGAPVFYEYIPKQYVTYWFFYPYNAFSIKIIRPGFPLPHVEEVEVQTHEGDWERISVQLDENNLPVNVFYYSHDGGDLAAWGTLEMFEGTHPVVYSAKGSHGSFQDEGVHLTNICYPILGCVPDHTDRGPRWATWNRLQAVKSQPWYGFGGAWGEVHGNVGTPYGTILPGAEFTGPLGPSQYKNSRNKWILNISGRVTHTDGLETGGATGLSGATVKLTSMTPAGLTTQTAITDSTGSYSFANVRAGRNYMLTPAKTGYVFTPTSKSIIYLSDNLTQNFTATLKPYRIGGVVKLGTAGLASVTVKLTSPTPTGFTARTTMTSSAGAYLFTNVPAGRNYTVTPQKLGYQFTTSSKAINNLSTNQTAVNFAVKVFSISGQVTRTGSNAGIGMVKITATSPTPAGFTARTAETSANGNYVFTNLPAGRNYTIKPTKSGFTFSPASKSITNLSSNIPVGASTRFTGTGRDRFR